MCSSQRLSLPVCVFQVRSDRDKFTVYLDVKHFSPDDLSVKVTDDYVEIQGKHGERQVEFLLSKGGFWVGMMTDANSFYDSALCWRISTPLQHRHTDQL